MDASVNLGDGEQADWRKLVGFFILFLFIFNTKFLDKTGQNSKDGRDGEIQDWLDAHPNVKKYVILDDDSMDIVGSYTTKKHPNNFVRTNSDFGLQDADVQKAVEILNCP